MSAAGTLGGGPRPGVREQFGDTRRAATGLIKAHLELARAELAEILSFVKTLGIIAAVALVVALFTGNLAYVGTWLFLGEWLFGSLGWGLAHGVLFGMGLLIMLGLLFLGAGAGSTVRALVLSILVGIVIAVLIGSNISWTALRQVASGMTLPLGLDPTAWLGGAIGALVLGLLGLLVGARVGGLAGAIGGLVAGAVAGLAVGLFMGRHHSWRVAIAAGIALALLLWSVLQVQFARARIDLGKRFAVLKPSATIETTMETKDWLGEQWANRRSTLGRR